MSPKGEQADSPLALHRGEREACAAGRWRWAIAPYASAFRRPILTARGAWSTREGWFLCVRDEAGAYGLAELAPLPDWGSEAPEAAWRAVAPLLGQGSLPCDETSLAASLEASGLSRRGTPAAYGACEAALLDLLARRAGLSLAQSLARFSGAAVAAGVPLNALLTAAEPEALAEEARSTVGAGFTALKLKIGALPLAGDLARVRAVREALPPGVLLRLDANGGWSRAEALDALRAFAAWDVEYVEQPIAAEDAEGLAWLSSRSPVAVAADEAVRSLESATALIEREAVPVLVLKPMAIGGLGATAAITDAARARGVRVVVTSTLDRGLASAAVAHWAATVPGLPPCGLATAGFFSEAPALAGYEPVAGALQLPSGPGIAGRLQDPALQALVEGRP